MAENYLEKLIAEWYEYQGYIVKRNVHVGKLPAGGYEGELDILGFHPAKHHLVHIEASTDADSWQTREERFTRKFSTGRKYVNEIFAGIDIPSSLDQIAVLIVASKKSHCTVGGGRIILIKELLADILRDLKDKDIMREVIPEHYPILRTLQFMCGFRDVVLRVWSGDDL
jgi:hypothetical protein